jgi:WD40 repeat protein
MRVNCNTIHGVAFGGDGGWLALACSDARVRIVEVATGRNRRVLRGHTQAVAAVALAPDGTWLASAGWDATVRIWDARTGKARAVLTGLTDWPQDLAIAPDGQWVAAGGYDGMVYVWHAPTGTLSASARVDARVVTACRWWPDGAGLCATGGGEAYLFTFTPGAPAPVAQLPSAGRGQVRAVV